MKLLLVLLACTGALAIQDRYDNYEILRLQSHNEEQVQAVLALEGMGYLYLDPPHGLVGHETDVIVPPHKYSEIRDILQRLNFEWEVKNRNLQELIDNEGRYRGDSTDAFDWTDYYPLQNIHEWLDSLVEKYPGIVTPLNAGRSYQNRPLKGVKISYRSGNPGIFIESNIHAREWISSAVSTWIINHLLTSNDPTVRNLRETIDWYVVPVMNPDGFVHSHTSSRLWRKTRAPSSSICIGADPNRNFGFKWLTGGSSTQPCSDTFAGSSAFSEIETRTFSEFYRTIARNITAYIDFHNFSQLLMYPYGTKDGNVRISNEAEHIQVGKKMQEAIAKRYNKEYKFGDIATTIYVASGGSIDWVKGELDTPFVFVYELRDDGTHGFTLPKENIVPNAEEVWDSIEEMVKEARKLDYFKQ